MHVFSILCIIVAWVGLVLNYRFLSLLRTRHPDLWRSVGEPTLWSHGGSVIESLPVLRLLWHRGYRAVADPSFRRLGDMVRACNLLFIGMSLTLLFCFLLTLIR